MEPNHRCNWIVSDHLVSPHILNQFSREIVLIFFTYRYTLGQNV